MSTLKVIAGLFILTNINYICLQTGNFFKNNTQSGQNATLLEIRYR